jgi:hypothetical protein
MGRKKIIKIKEHVGGRHVVAQGKARTFVTVRMTNKNTTLF